MALDYVTLKTLHPYVLPHVSGCPPAQVDNALRLAAIDFLRSTQFWTHEPAAVSIVSTEPHYTITIPAFSTIERILSARWRDTVDTEATPLGGYSESEMEQRHGGSWREDTGAPTEFIHDEQGPETIRLYPIPDDDFTSALLLKVSLVPSLDCQKLPGWVARRYHQAICALARANLMAIPEKEWTNPVFSAAEQREYEEKLTIAISDRMTGHQTKSQKMVARYPLA